MTISYDSATGTVRGNAEEIETVRSSFVSGDPTAGGALPGGDPILEAICRAAGSRMLSLELTNSGPGGFQRHLLEAGTNAVTMRTSIAGSEVAELGAFPFQVLPGSMTRLVNFVPGRAPDAGAEPVRVPAERLTALAAEDVEERIGAWHVVKDLLAELIDPAEADASWQLVRAHSSWTTTNGEDTEDLVVYLRAGESYFVLVQDGEELDLVPVPSITAWETLVRVLPGAGEIKDPRS